MLRFFYSLSADRLGGEAAVEFGEDLFEFVQAVGFDDEAEGTLAERLDDDVLGAVVGDHDDGELGVGVAEVGEELKAARTRELDVEKDEIEAVAAEDVPGRPGRFAGGSNS